jgi:hypothetical protein
MSQISSAEYEYKEDISITEQDKSAIERFVQKIRIWCS